MHVCFVHYKHFAADIHIEHTFMLVPSVLFYLFFPPFDVSGIRYSEQKLTEMFSYPCVGRDTIYVSSTSFKTRMNVCI